MIPSVPGVLLGRAGWRRASAVWGRRLWGQSWRGGGGGGGCGRASVQGRGAVCCVRCRTRGTELAGGGARAALWTAFRQRREQLLKSVEDLEQQAEQQG